MKARDPAWKTHTRRESLNLRAEWEQNAASFIAWARKPGLDSYWRFHRDQFLEIVPPPGHLTIDIGCGEGRVARELTARGHTVIALDASPTMVVHAKETAPDQSVVVADAAALPLLDGCADLAIAFMCLQDIDDLEQAFAEAGRVLEPNGRLCIAIVHPINSAGHFEDVQDESPFIIPGSYLDRFHYEDHMEREGVEVTFASVHRPLEMYVRALAAAGFLLELLQEPAMPDGGGSTRPNDRRWKRIPMFMHFRAIRA
jgi:SAM-dependent methyltransferase